MAVLPDLSIGPVYNVTPVLNKQPCHVGSDWVMDSWSNGSLSEGQGFWINWLETLLSQILANMCCPLPSGESYIADSRSWLETMVLGESCSDSSSGLEMMVLGESYTDSGSALEMMVLGESYADSEWLQIIDWDEGSRRELCWFGVTPDCGLRWRF